MPADPTPLAIAKEFARLCRLVSGISSAYHYMPEEYAKLPTIAMLQRRVVQEDRYTGAATENTWTWAVHLVIGIGGRVAGSDFQQSQELLYTLVPLILKVQRDNPDLTGLAIRTWISDLGEEPEIDGEQGHVTKILEFGAVSSEV